MGPDAENVGHFGQLQQTDENPQSQEAVGVVRTDRSAAEKLVLFGLQIGAIELLPGGRKLKSGRVSPYFFNSALFNTGHGLSVLAGAYAASVNNAVRPDVLFGPAYKGIPLVAAVATHIGGDIGYAFDRKEEKDHGEGGVVVGYPMGGKTVAILDDVMTTGTSVIEAASIICKNGGTPTSCVIAFDRQERVSGDLSAVQEFEKNHKIPVLAAATLEDLIRVLGDLGNHEMLKKIHIYKAQYGAKI